MSYTYALCPYCDENTAINYEGEEDGRDFETECGKCNKIFICNVEFEVNANCSKMEEKE